jgi:hypothetical protein
MMRISAIISWRSDATSDKFLYMPKQEGDDLWAERRKAKRYKARIPVSVYLQSRPNDPINAEIRNISEAGAFIQCSAPPEVGDRIVVEMRIGEARLLPGVVNILEGEQDTTLPPGIPPSAVIRWGQKNIGFGIEFENLDAETKRFILKLIKFIEETVPQ